MKEIGSARYEVGLLEKAKYLVSSRFLQFGHLLYYGIFALLGWRLLALTPGVNRR
jgi:hypothetical protein